MSNIGVGKEIVTHCSKCKLDLAHIIVVMKDEATPLRVQCKTCNSNHSFKVQKIAAPKRKVGARNSKPRVSAADKLLNIWEAAMKKSKETIPYSIKTKFEVGQVLDHPTFGPGVVEKAIDANKIEVVFKTSSKVLMHAK